MKVQCTPLTDFDHDDMKLRADRQVMIDRNLAQEFEARGLVRIARVVNRRVDDALTQHGGGSIVARKVQAAGAIAPSSASPVGHLLPQTTVTQFAAGAKRKRGA